MEWICWNATWFVLFFLVGFIYGIIRGWNKRVSFVILLITIIAIVIMLFVVLLSDTPFESTEEWYYYIGSMVGGLVMRMSAKIGEDTYRKHIRSW